MKRSAGILMHISSLPNKFGIGTFGKEAYKFAVFLKLSEQSYWQILPISPIGIGNSPYSCLSSFAINPYFIDLEFLCEDGILKRSDFENFDWGKNKNFIDYEKIKNQKINVLQTAFINFKKTSTLNNEFYSFIEKNKFIKEYSIFMALKNYFKTPIKNWPAELKNKSKYTIKKYEEKLKDKIEFFQFTQFIAFRQWTNLKKYINSLGIKIIGDLPFYIGLDSSDVFFHKENFLLDENYFPRYVSGCPADKFSPDAQVWNHPLYNWNFMKNNNYKWWMDRIKHSLKLFDLIRLDHFRGFESFFCIPYNDISSKDGFWEKGPGEDFLNTIKNQVNPKNIIAENLGYITKDVEKLLDLSGFYGMHVLELFSFLDKNSLPHHYKKNSVAYTGTHDNNTLIGWLNDLTKEQIDFLKKYANIKSEKISNWDLISLVYKSVANLVIIPMQDFLSLDKNCRMNIPSTKENNWRWHMNNDYNLDFVTSNKIKRIVETFKRQPF